jgi:hypothetical protein
MPVSQDVNGWTVVTESGDTVKIYVSSTGNDSDNGLTSVTPKRTLAAAIALLRTGYPDWLLLKKGDVWTETFGTWTKDGRSMDEPMLIGTYGSGARPWLKSATTNGTLFQGGSQVGRDVNYLFVLGIDFYNTKRDPNHADFTGLNVLDICFRWLGPSNGLHIEDCRFAYGILGLTIQNFYGAVSNVTIRRNVIHDNVPASSGHSQGIYAQGVSGITIEENWFVHNGWIGVGTDTIFNHSAYIYADCTNLVAVGNVIAQSSSHGLQARPGGIVQNNLFIDNPTEQLLLLAELAEISAEMPPLEPEISMERLEVTS